jgi:hypothetical protein
MTHTYSYSCITSNGCPALGSCGVLVKINQPPTQPTQPPLQTFSRIFPTAKDEREREIFVESMLLYSGQGRKERWKYHW